MTTSAPVAPSAALLATLRDDDRGDRIALLRGTAIVASGWAVAAALQIIVIVSLLAPESEPVAPVPRLLTNLTAVVTLVAVLAVAKTHRTTRFVKTLPTLVVAAALATVLRFGSQLLFGVYTDPASRVMWTELITGFLSSFVSVGIGVWSLSARRTERAKTRAAEREAVQVEMVVKALEQEEIRVRREVAEGLHGTLQSKLVLVDARLRALEDHLSSGTLDEQDHASLRWVRTELDRARRTDVREMSRLLHPDRLELGLVPALRALLGRLPASITTRLDVDDAVRSMDQATDNRITVTERLMAVRVVEEGVTNALKHGLASTIAVDVSFDDPELVVVVENDGQAYDPATAGAASGTERLRQRLAFAHGTVSLEPTQRAGARLVARFATERGPVAPAYART